MHVCCISNVLHNLKHCMHHMRYTMGTIELVYVAIYIYMSLSDYSNFSIESTL